MGMTTMASPRTNRNSVTKKEKEKQKGAVPAPVCCIHSDRKSDRSVGASSPEAVQASLEIIVTRITSTTPDCLCHPAFGDGVRL